jgi:hypothetical protein
MGVLSERGPFDLVYLSNALTYAGNNTSRYYEKLKNVVKPGGYLLCTSTREYDYGMRRYRDVSDSASRHAKEFGFELIVSETPQGANDASITWNYSVLQAPEGEADVQRSTRSPRRRAAASSRAA